MAWDVRLTPEVRKSLKKLPKGVNEIFQLLLAELQLGGPIRHNWPNYSKLSANKTRHHCHLKKGNPTYVAVWQVVEKRARIIEVNYVGTHAGVRYE